MSPDRKATISTFGRTVARVLSEIRIQTGTTQAELAERTGISQSQLSKQLRGIRAINIDELAAICDALQVSMPQIIKRVDRELSTNLQNDRSTVTYIRPQRAKPMPFRAVADGSEFHEEENSEFDD